MSFSAPQVSFGRRSTQARLLDSGPTPKTPATTIAISAADLGPLTDEVRVDEHLDRLVERWRGGSTRRTL